MYTSEMLCVTKAQNEEISNLLCINENVLKTDMQQRLQLVRTNEFSMIVEVQLSRGSLTTQLRCGGNLHYTYIDNFRGCLCK